MQNKIQNLTSNSIELLKENFQLIISLSIISATLNISYQILFRFPSYVNSAGTKILLSLLMFALLIPFIYYSTRILIATIILINHRIHEKETSIKIAFSESKKLFWGFFGNGFLFSLLLLIPFAILSIPSFLDLNLLITLLLKALGILVGIYLVLNYGMSVIISVLKPQEKSYFRKSEELFKENKSLMIQAYIVIAILFFINSYLPNLIFTDHLFFDLVNSNLIFSELIGVIITPLMLVIMVFLFWHSNTETSEMSNKYFA